MQQRADRASRNAFANGRSAFALGDLFIAFGLNRAFCTGYHAFFTIATTTTPATPTPTTLIAFTLSGFFRTQARGTANHGAFRVRELRFHAFGRAFQRQIDGFGYGLRRFALAAFATLAAFSTLATRLRTLGAYLAARFDTLGLPVTTAAGFVATFCACAVAAGVTVRLAANVAASFATRLAPGFAFLTRLAIGRARGRTLARTGPTAVAVAATAAAAFGAFTTLARAFTCRRSRSGRLRGRGFHGHRCTAKQALEPAEKAAGGHRNGGRRGRNRTRCGGWRRTVRRNAFHRGFLLGLHFFGTLAVTGVRFQFLSRFLRHFPAGGRFVQARIVVAQTLQLVVRCFEVLVRDQQDVDLETRLDLVDFLAFFIEQERGHFDRHLAMNRRGVFLHRFFLDDAQDLQCGRFGIADVAGAVTARAGDMAAFGERRTQALARQFHQAEARDLAHLHASAVVLERVFEALFDFALALRRFHIDEVDDDQAAQVAQAQLASHFVGGFQVGASRGFLDVGAFGRARRVDVDRDQRFGMVDHDGAARRQRHGARIGGFDLVLDLEARKQRHIVVVPLDLVHVVRHHHAHERACLLFDFLGVDQDFADIGLEVIAYGADHQARLEINQQGAARRAGGLFDGAPQLHQVIQVPLQFLGATSDSGGAGDDAHAVRQFELRHGFAQFLTLVALDTARNAAAARIVGHQHQVAASQRNKGREGSAFIAAFFFLDLDDQLLAFAQRILDACRTCVDAVLEILTSDFLEWQKTMAIFAIVDETGFERGLDARHDAFVNIAFTLFATGGFNIDVDQLLAIDDGDAQFFLLRRIK